ncbi:uncharacterized protein LOC122371027 [Amphibalanus amphitrite]|uniref:uncharacterized protein LOC122369804 n=1 Tax=Amphibalanus amphitrite TaxID=1232801 RepID=UPI001C925979|nr:uncharacterized protein LOC122369804 [Amphibalanus amphitrite]XP_043203003.1 uncharacterized protein LOC122371027 [Amphibalanus amphitrite]
MGNINHSRMMMDTARTAVCQTLLSNLKEHVESQPCVAVLADKVTIARRTVDITAIQTLVPNAEPDHIFQTFVVGAPVVKNHDGEALAADICSTLSEVGVTNTEKIAAVAADGQFHHNGVPQKLARLLESSSGCPIPAVWDQAHLMNLAESDARKHCNSRWVRDTIETVTEVNKMFSIGKGWEDLRRCGEDMGEPVLRPKLWSETRFAAYAAEVFSVFRRNEKQLRAALRRKRMEETRPSHLKELERLLVSLNDPAFHARVRALEDIYGVLGAASKAVQRTQSLPWERHADQQEAVETIRRMKVALVTQHKKSPTTEDLLCLADKDELWPRLSASEPSVPAAEVAKIAFFCTSIMERLKFRGAGQDVSGSDKNTANNVLGQSMADLRAVADLHQLAGSTVPVPVAARLYREAGERLVRRKLIPVDTVPTEGEIRSVLPLLRRHREETNQQLWKMLNRHADDHSARALTNLVTRIWLLSPPESVVESMGSVIAEVFGEHRQLEHGNAAKELIVRWNGPSLCRADRLLSRVHRHLSRDDSFRCVRRTTTIGQSFHGTVITRHKRAPDHRACLWT